jgi:hypothetical protein
MKSNSASVSATIFAGIGIGLLTGILLGMSVSNVVGTVIAGLTALLAAFLGLSEKASKPPADQDTNDTKYPEVRSSSLRIGSFGLACVGGIMLGVYIRTHDSLSPSVETRYEAWKRIGFTEKEARELIAFERIKTASDKPEKDAATTNKIAPERSVLFASMGENCNDLDPEKFTSVSETLHAWNLTGGKWAQFAKLISENIPSEKQKAALIQTWKILCD